MPRTPPRRRLFRALFVLAAVAALVALGARAARWFPRGGDGVAAREEPVRVDSAARAEWGRVHPWLFREDSLAYFHGNFLLPFALEHALTPRAVRRRGDFAELVIPRGRPVHAVAHDLEQSAERAGLRVQEGHEIGNAADRVEYRLADPAGRVHAVRVILGAAVTPGSFRMALVVVELGRASDADLRAWMELPFEATLVLPDTVRAPHPGGSPAKDLLVELPMEPAAWPHVKPGPRALFIDHARDQAERILRARLEAVPGAAGFATRHGDRAIEHPGLMETVLGFASARGLLFLDLTGSPRSLTAQASLATGAQGFSSAIREVGDSRRLREEMDRRAGLALRSGEGILVLRHAPGLPAEFARAARAQAASGDPAPRWVTLRNLRVND